VLLTYNPTAGEEGEGRSAGEGRRGEEFPYNPTAGGKGGDWRVREGEGGGKRRGEKRGGGGIVERKGEETGGEGREGEGRGGGGGIPLGLLATWGSLRISDGLCDKNLGEELSRQILINLYPPHAHTYMSTQVKTYIHTHTNLHV